MTLREEFENTMKNAKGGISLLFEVRNSQYIEWLENELSKLRQGAVISSFDGKCHKDIICAKKTAGICDLGKCQNEC